MQEYPQDNEPRAEEKGWVRWIRWRAVAAGILADVAATMALWSLYVSTFMKEKIERHGGVDRIPEQALSQEELLALGLIGLAGTLFGGYTAGRIAAVQETRHGVVVAVSSLVLGFCLELALQGLVRLHWWEVPLLILTVPAGAFGGFIAKWMHRKTG